MTENQPSEEPFPINQKWISRNPGIPRPAPAATEQEIMGQWPENSAPLVSIICHCYNHEKFITDALDGFLMQKTNFPWEVIVHDDSSTDDSKSIIAKYAKQYPSLIRPILQKYNQYSQGRKPLSFSSRYARGNFVAFCEGDDYWTDPKKLEKQIEAMQSHEKCTLSFHAAIAIYADGSKAQRIKSDHGDSIRTFPLPDVIKGGGGWMPTASLIIHRSRLDEVVAFQKRYPLLPAGDIIIQTICSTHGALYVPGAMSIYRVRTPGSWSDSMNDMDRRIAHRKNISFYYQGMLETITDSSIQKVLLQKYAKENLSFARKLMKKRRYKESVRFFGTGLLTKLKLLGLSVKIWNPGITG